MVSELEHALRSWERADRALRKPRIPKKSEKSLRRLPAAGEEGEILKSVKKGSKQGSRLTLLWFFRTFWPPEPWRAPGSSLTFSGFCQGRRKHGNLSAPNCAIWLQLRFVIRIANRKSLAICDSVNLIREAHCSDLLQKKLALRF